MPAKSPDIPRLRLVLALCCALLLASCVVPEHYIARMKIEADGSYKLYVEGTAAHVATVRVLRQIEAEAKGGKLKGDELKKRQAEAQEQSAKDMEKARADKRVLNVSAIDGGRVRFSFDGAWTMDREALIVNDSKEPLTYAAGPDGTWRLRVKDAVPPREAKGLGVQTEGSLAIVLAPGIEVLEHNAQKAPTVPNGAYRWTIGPDTTEAPYLRVRFPASGQKVEQEHKSEAGRIPSSPGSQKGLARTPKSR